ncbi:phage terminase small subunit P27 family [Adhaeribacter terreus]|uniref:Phage terminase small subunit P27 family n=1 Tax=Adhaeribacter terreus TaxID=529703 RepID=A0ABW0EAW9_9BACT
MARYREETQTKKLKGTYRKSRELKAPEALEPFTEIPAAPVDLPELARHVWNTTGAELVKNSILTNIDIPLFKSYCYQCFVIAEAQQHLETEGFTIMLTNTKKQSYPAKSPWISILNDAVQLANRLGSQFGLNPLSRQKLNFKDAEKEKDALAEYMNWQNL